MSKLIICIYRGESENGYTPNITNANVDEILGVKRNLSKMALENKEEPPTLEIWCTTIPDYSKKGDGSGVGVFHSRNHRAANLKLAVDLSEKFGEDAKVVDFTSKIADDNDLGFMNEQSGKGCIIDLMKVKAIITEKEDSLVLDGNTKIFDYQGLYNDTFSKSNGNNTDGLQALIYTQPFPSANNKIQYTPSESKLKETLRKHYTDYVSNNIDNSKIKHPNSNVIYEECFRPALKEEGFVDDVRVGSKTKYKANLNTNIYGITKYIFPAVNMSWLANNLPPSEKKKLDQLKSIPGVVVGDAVFDFSAFKSAIDKYTREDSRNNYASDVNLLMEHSNESVDIDACAKFLISTQNLQSELQNDLISQIPNNRYGLDFKRKIEARIEEIQESVPAPAR
ncbi:MAG: hypothetical protein U1E78_11395 [Gammaproteobacteria bacterium]